MGVLSVDNDDADDDCDNGNAAADVNNSTMTDDCKDLTCSTNRGSDLIVGVKLVINLMHMDRNNGNPPNHSKHDSVSILLHFLSQFTY
jgi:hypothetical protein